MVNKGDVVIVLGGIVVVVGTSVADTVVVVASCSIVGPVVPGTNVTWDPSAFV